jgi:predicted MFS family arabinose efflux permease
MKSPRAALALALFAVAYGTNVSTPLLLLYKNELALSTWTVTALFAVYPLGLAPALAFSGPASDVLGRKRVMVPGLALSGIGSAVMMAGSQSVAMLYVGRFLLGAVSGIVFVVASAWIQEISPDDAMWATRLNSLVVYAGFGAGPLISGVLGQWGPAPLFLPFTVHLTLVAMAFWVVRRVPETVKPDRSRRIGPRLGIPPGKGPVFATLVAPTALGVFGMTSLGFGLFPVLLQPAMASVAIFATGLMNGISSAAIVPMQALVGRIGPYRSAPLGIVVGTMGCLLGTVAFLTDFWQILFLASACLGAGSGLCMTSGLRFVDIYTDPADRGALTGAFYAVTYAGMTMPVVVATISGPSGYALVLGALTMIAAAGAVWLFRMSKKAREATA